MSRLEVLVHNRVQLALHELRGPGEAVHGARPLLLLHGLGESSPRSVPDFAATWPGPVHALDFTGHGASTRPTGGGYGAEILLADADAAVARGDEVTVVGRGLGAYIALMLIGSRPSRVRGAVLCDGPGLAGGAIAPTSESFFVLPRGTDTRPDPYVLFELSRDLRPPEYATTFARLALEGCELDEPIAVAAVVRPPWLDAVVSEVGVVTATADEALRTFAEL